LSPSTVGLYPFPGGKSLYLGAAVAWATERLVALEIYPTDLAKLPDEAWRDLAFKVGDTLLRHVAEEFHE
jgi:hypothetical protein